MPTVLITGANRGLGLEFARQYSGDGWRVIATCRDLARADTLQGLPAVEVHELDVVDFAAVYALGRDLAGEPIDVLIANAGTNSIKPMTLAAVDEAGWIAEFRVNTMAPLVLAAAFREAVLRSAQRRMVALTSVHASIGSNRTGGLYAYRTSKTGLHAGWRSWAVDNPEIVSMLVHPGWVRTDMGGPGADIDAETSVSGMRRLIAAVTLEQTGLFFRYDGVQLPW